MSSKAQSCESCGKTLDNDGNCSDCDPNTDGEYGSEPESENEDESSGEEDEEEDEEEEE